MRIGKKILATGLQEARGPMDRAYRAQDSMSMLTMTVYNPPGLINGPAMQGESCNDHESEEDVECKGDRVIWGTEVACGTCA